MDFKKLMELIELEQQNLREISNQDDPEIKFFDQLTSNNNLTTFQGLLTFDKEEVLTGLLCAYSNELGYQKINELIQKNKLMLADDFGAIGMPIIKILDIEKNHAIPKMFGMDPINEIKNLIKKQNITSFDLESLKF